MVGPAAEVEEQGGSCLDLNEDWLMGRANGRWRKTERRGNFGDGE